MKDKLENIRQMVICYINRVKGKKALKILLIFFVVMIAMTLLSRITYNAIIPKVTLERVEERVIDHSIEIQGKVESVDQCPVFAAEGLIIDTFFVKQGEQVHKGAHLYSINEESLNKKVYDLSDDIYAMKKQINLIKMSSDSSNNPEIYTLNAELKKKERELKKYKSIKNSGYIINAPIDGVVVDIRTQVGEFTAGDADVILADISNGYIVSGTIDDVDDLNYIKAGINANVYSEYSEQEDATVTSVVIDKANGSKEVFVKVDSEIFTLNESVRICINATSQKYDNCVSRKALHLDNDEYFVYSIRKEKTILGEELTAVKIRVEVLDKNMDYVALEGVTEGQEIIIQSDKIIEEKTRVRVLK